MIGPSGELPENKSGESGVTNSWNGTKATSEEQQILSLIELVVMPESWGLQIGCQLNTSDWKDDSYISCAPEENCLFVKLASTPEFLGI